MFPEDVFYHEDWEFFSRLSRRYPVAYLDVETAVLYMHEGAQLTKLPSAEILKARLRVLDRVWGTDQEFLAHHLNDFNRVVRHHRLRRVMQLLMSGVGDDAKRELQNIEGAPLRYRVACRLPQTLTPALLRLYQTVRRSSA
jgi:hypothetical protein